MGQELRCLSSSGPELSGVRWGVVLNFVKVKIKPCVPHCSSSRQNPSPAAELIFSSQRSLSSLPELWRAWFNKVYFWNSPFVSNAHIFCTVFRKFCSLISTQRIRQSLLIKAIHISHSLMCVRGSTSAPPLHTSTLLQYKPWHAPGYLYSNRPSPSPVYIHAYEHRNVKSRLGGNQGLSLLVLSNTGTQTFLCIMNNTGTSSDPF